MNLLWNFDISWDATESERDLKINTSKKLGKISDV